MTSQPEAPCIWIAGGGTGGHLYPGLSLASAIRAARPDARILFVGTRYGLDADLVPRHGFRVAFLPTGRGSPLSLRHPLNAARFLHALWVCRRLLRDERPDVIVSLGGFAASVPGLMGAWKGIPLLLLEQNVLPGRVTRLLSRWATEIHSQFDEARAHLGGRARFHYSGSPARPEIAALASARPEGTRLLIMGGSQGARRLNELVRDALPRLLDAGIPVTHISGSRDHPLVEAAYRDLPPERAQLLSYVDDMAGVLAQSRMAFVRAGASTMNDIELAGVPSVLVPFPHARDDHQTANARVFEQAGCGVVWPEDTLAPETFADRLIALWNNAAVLEDMRAALRRRARPTAAADIAAAVLRLAARPAP